MAKRYSRSRGRTGYSRGGGGRTTRRRSAAPRGGSSARAQRVVIQVVGAPAPTPSPLAFMKAAPAERRRQF